MQSQKEEDKRLQVFAEFPQHLSARKGSSPSRASRQGAESLFREGDFIFTQIAKQHRVGPSRPPGVNDLQSLAQESQTETNVCLFSRLSAHRPWSLGIAAIDISIAGHPPDLRAPSRSRYVPLNVVRPADRRTSPHRDYHRRAAPRIQAPSWLAHGIAVAWPTRRDGEAIWCTASFATVTAPIRELPLIMGQADALSAPIACEHLLEPGNSADRPEVARSPRRPVPQRRMDIKATIA
jgi:hypothetical protein